MVSGNMLLLLLSAMCASVAQAAVLPRDKCNSTAVVTVTPPVVTETSEYNFVTYYTTTSVTVDALSTNAALSARGVDWRHRFTAKTTAKTVATPTAKTNAGKIKTVASPTATAKTSTTETLGACQQASTTITTTLPASTTTVTTTYTYSEAAQATATAQACNPSNNYGLFNGTLNIDLHGPIPTTQTFPDLTIGECCDACFSSTEGCLAWSFDGVAGGDGVQHAGCSMNILSSGCPAGNGETGVILYPNSEKGMIGIGPCDVEVAYFNN